MKEIYTRFRAYQLGGEGSSFSYFADNHFTLIEARFDERNIPSIKSELNICAKKRVDCLHITSWDQDHCSPKELAVILEEFLPSKVEYPGYEPDSKCGKESKRILSEYKKRKTEARLQGITPEYIDSLNIAGAVKYRDVFYHPKFLSEKNNDNSSIKLFRRGSFNVLSLGDVESQEIGSYLKSAKLLHSEVDVMILAHHGADNGFTSKALLKSISPSVAICSSNYDNKFEHPRQEVCDLLAEQDNIPIFTTKRGDVIIESIGAHVKRYRVSNLDCGNTEVSSQRDFNAKKFDLLKSPDNVRAHLRGKGRPSF